MKVFIIIFLLFFAGSGCTLRIYQEPKPGEIDRLIKTIADSLRIQLRQQAKEDSLALVKFNPERGVKSMPKKIFMIDPIIVTCPTCGYTYSTIMQPHWCPECRHWWFEEGNVPPWARK